jgi:histidyl-tRNA synthetase
MAADAEVAIVACELLGALGVGSFVVRLNHRKVLTALMEKIGVPAGPAEAGILRTIDKLPKIGEEETRRLLRDENGLDGGRVDSIFQFLGIRGKPEAVLVELARFFPEGSVGACGVAELAEVFSILRGAEAESHAEIDLSIARGLNYYTGTIYEVFLGDLPGYGAVMGGGRYDGLVGIFKGEAIPAVGISLGVDRLLEGLVELGVLREGKNLASVLVTVFDSKLAPYSAGIARHLRSAGIACELFPFYQKIGKQFRHAERSGCRWVVVAGPDEEAGKQVSVKDLETGRQEPVSLDKLPAYLASKMQASPTV